MQKPVKKKIIFVISSFVRGGAEEYVLTVAKFLILNNWEVHAVLEKTEKNKSLIDDLSTAGVICHDRNIAEEDYSYNYFDTKNEKCEIYKKLFKEINPDIIQINLQWYTKGFPAMMAAYDLNIKTIVMFHLVPHIFEVDENIKKQYQIFLEKNQFWLTVSNYNKTNIIKSFNVNTDIPVIYNGIDLEKFNFKRKNDARKKIITEFGIPDDSFIIIAVGGCNKQKGYEYLLEAISKLINDFSNIFFLLVGDGPLKEELENNVKQYDCSDKIIFTGYRNDVPELLAASNLFVNSSIFEGFPFSIIEAMASGLPIVSTNLNGIQELITHQKHGLLCETRDSQKLHKTIKYAINNYNKIQEMAKNAGINAKIFSKGMMLSRTLFFINNL